jgi:aromatic ring-opening dioxygenase LigB subunit
LIVAAAIAPHGTPAFDPSPTREAMEEIGRRFEQAGPEATIVFTPHNVHVEGHYAVIVAAELVGDLAQWDRPDVELERTSDRELAAAVLDGLRTAGLPALGVSYGGNDPSEALMPMDWGTLIPLVFLPETPVVVVSPARDRPLEEHVRAGAAIAAATGVRRVALVASADHGHAHDPESRYGFDPASAEFDERVVEIVRENRLERLLEFGDLVGPAKADSLWQMVMLHGALGDGWRGDFLTYEASTYFGMLCAAYAPN